MKKARVTTLGVLLMLAAMVSPTANAQKTVFTGVFAPSEGLVNKTETQYRHEICLNGYWDFQAVPLPKGFRQGKDKAPELTQPEAGKWDKTRIKIPSPWNINDFAFRNLEGPDHRNYPSYPKEWESVKMAWMKKTVNVPADWSGETVKLHFEAVAGMAEVYVNGKKVGENFDLFLPFDIDVTDALNIWVARTKYSSACAASGSLRTSRPSAAASCPPVRCGETTSTVSGRTCSSPPCRR